MHKVTCADVRMVLLILLMILFIWGILSSDGEGTIPRPTLGPIPTEVVEFLPGVWEGMDATPTKVRPTPVPVTVEP